MKCFLLITLLLVGVASAQSVSNPTAVDSIELKLVLSGNIEITGNAEYVNLSLYIPQEGVSKIDANADWHYIFDGFGNRMVLLEWNMPEGNIDYRLEVLLRNSAKHLKEEKKIGYDPFYLKETDSVVINDDIRKTAYPYEKSLQRVAELAILVNDIIKYDGSLVNQNKPSDWVLKNRRGVCAEHSVLLLALLRASGIPARYVSGYAYSNLDKKFIGHAWVEVLLEDGSWTQFDPTWLQGGYLDATHIRTASLLNGNQTDVVICRGCKLNWTRNAEEIEILSYKEMNLTSIILATEAIAINEYGYIAATVKDECSITELSAKSCISDKEEMLTIFDKTRKFWFCGEKEVYWFFVPEELETEYVYTCPVGVHDQIGTSDVINIEVSGEKESKEIFISGPSTAGINEDFMLEASDDGIFYSKELGRNPDKTWKLKLGELGTYGFYLYSDGALVSKDVEVIEKKEFDLSVSIPKNASLGNFFVNVTANNLLTDRTAKIIIKFDEQTIEKDVQFGEDETKKLSINLSAENPGTKEISVSFLSDTITSHTSSILIYGVEEERTWWQKIIDSFARLFDNVGKFIANLFG